MNLFIDGDVDPDFVHVPKLMDVYEIKKYTLIDFENLQKVLVVLGILRIVC